MEIRFVGAAGEVTGSCHRVTVGGRSVLVDCGLIQGGRDAPERNREPFPFAARDISAVLLTHAHVDHSGRLPLLVRRGFRGPIYMSAACGDLLPILLRDSVALAMRRGSFASGGRAATHADPSLYDLADVDQVLEQVQVLRYDTPHTIFPGVGVTFREAGHILGSASLELHCEETGVARTVVFSGDLGPYDSPILRDPHAFERADLVVMESTYGDRRHRDRDATTREFGEVLAEAARDGGNVVVPAFAVGRSQEILYLLGGQAEAWQLHQWKVFLDSPMAIEASRVYWAHPERYDEEALGRRAGFLQMPTLAQLHFCRTADESRAIQHVRSRALILAGSGMCTGGRVLHHLARELPRRESHVLITGYQARGTLGRALVDGAEEVRIHGARIRVAAKIHTLGGLSAHADQADLIRWYGHFTQRPPVCLVHGDTVPAAVLRDRLTDQGVAVRIPARGDRIDLRTLQLVGG